MPAPNLFSTDVLMRVVESLKTPRTFLLDRYFRQQINSQDEYIHFDTVVKGRRMAPFCSPLVEGKVRREVGRKTTTFAPAYVKELRDFNPNRPMARAVGEAIGGSLDPETRLRALVASETTDIIESIVRRMEKMACEALVDGKIVVTGEGYESTEVDFGRDATLSAEVPSPKWDQANATPLDDLAEWAGRIIDIEGASPVDVVMDPYAWKHFRKDATVEKRLDKVRSTGGELVQNAVFDEGGTLMGTCDGFNIWVYQSYYTDSAGATQKFFPEGTVLVLSPQIDGVRAYGAIRDEEAGYQAVPYFINSWTERNPSVRYLMGQSAPLVVPARPNASLSANVKT